MGLTWRAGCQDPQPHPHTRLHHCLPQEDHVLGEGPLGEEVADGEEEDEEKEGRRGAFERVEGPRGAAVSPVKDGLLRGPTWVAYLAGRRGRRAA